MCQTNQINKIYMGAEREDCRARTLAGTTLQHNPCGTTAPDGDRLEYCGAQTLQHNHSAQPYGGDRSGRPLGRTLMGTHTAIYCASGTLSLAMRSRLGFTRRSYWHGVIWFCFVSMCFVSLLCLCIFVVSMYSVPCMFWH